MLLILYTEAQGLYCAVIPLPNRTDERVSGKQITLCWSSICEINGSRYSKREKCRLKLEVDNILRKDQIRCIKI